MPAIYPFNTSHPAPSNGAAFIPPGATTGPALPEQSQLALPQVAPSLAPATTPSTVPLFGKSNGGIPPHVPGPRTYPMPRIPTRFEPEFGRYGHYKLPSVTHAGEESEFPRVTTVGKVLDDTSGLERWSARKALVGIKKYPEILEAFDADNEDDRDMRAMIDRVFNVAKDAAGAGDAAVFGTAVHAWAEAVDLGVCTVDEVPNELRAHVAAYVKACRNCGLTPVPEYVERIVYNPVTGSAGRIDRIMRMADGTLVVVDVKTASSLNYGMLPISVQLSQYAFGEYLLSEDGTSWEEMPEGLHREYALVAHVPSTPSARAGGVHCDIVVVDLDAGHENMELAVKVKEARSRSRQLNMGRVHRSMAADPWPTEITVGVEDIERIAIPEPPREVALRRMQERVGIALNTLNDIFTELTDMAHNSMDIPVDGVLEILPPHPSTATQDAPLEHGGDSSLPSQFAIESTATSDVHAQMTSAIQRVTNVEEFGELWTRYKDYWDESWTEACRAHARVTLNSPIHKPT